MEPMKGITEDDNKFWIIHLHRLTIWNDESDGEFLSWFHRSTPLAQDPPFTHLSLNRC